MAIIFKTEERRVIPRLRSFHLALSTGELSLNGNALKAINLKNASTFIEHQSEVWKSNKNMSFAGDILGSAYVLGVTDQFEDVAKYVLDKSESEFDPLTILAAKLLRPAEIAIQIDDTSSISTITRHEIREVKQALIAEPKNPIAWMELGRLYALEGQVKKGEKAIDNALYLDKDNRFIVRSASRFYHHFKDDPERSLHVIKNAEFAKKDPWLISADIAFSQVMNRFSRVTKIGESYVTDNSKDIFSITELASALGTSEFKNGHTKQAKKYFRQSLLNPTDNSLAQVGWMAENLNGFDVDTLKYELPLAFEAKTIYYYEAGNFPESYDQALQWYKDEPFSVRPIKAASYILGFYYKKYNMSVELTRKGLQMDPTDVVLANNLVYYLVQNGQIEEAVILFEKSIRNVIQHPENYTTSEQMYCNATAGLILFKQNQIELGKLYYTKAIEISKKTKMWYLTALATVNYVRAALNSEVSDEEAESLMRQLKDTCRHSTAEDIKFMYGEILQQYNNRFEVHN
jgi:tetratricopeptide (TPR) repeat protein